MADAAFSPAGAAGTGVAAPLDAGEIEVARADGVMLGWQPSTIAVWWLPGLAFIALGWLEFRSLIVTVGLAAFCAALFLFYASDREVRPLGSRKQYVLTDRRLLIGAVAGRDGVVAWRSVPLDDVAATVMEEGFADLMVARLSGAATIVLRLRAPGVKGEPRRLRIGPMRRPREFRDRIEALLQGPA